MNPLLRNLAWSAVLFLYCAVVAAPVHAGLDIQAASTSPTLAVIDLTPDDDREAGVDILGWTTDLQAYLYTDRYQQGDRQQPAAGVPATARVGQGEQALTASALGPFGELAARMRPAPYGGLQFPSASARQTADVLLQPYSQLVVTGNTVLTARWEPQYGTQHFGSRGWFTALLYAQSPAEAASAFSTVELYSYTPGEPQFNSRDADYTLNFFNYGPAAVSLHLDLSVGGYADVVAVPEPPAPAMLAAGACVLGWHLRRRGASTTAGPARRRAAMRRLLATLLAVVALAPLARADGIGSTLELTGLTLDAVDLRPADGIAATVAIGPSHTSLMASILDASGRETFYRRPPPGTPGELYLGTPMAWGALHTDGTIGDFSLEAAADAAAPWHIVTTQALQDVSLIVSPYTRLSVAGHIAQAAGWTGPPSKIFAGTGRIDITLAGNEGGDVLFREFDLRGHEFPANTAYEDDYLLQLVNDTAAPMSFMLNINIAAIAYLDRVPVVPEPAALPMTVAGLAVCGAWAAVLRRRGASGARNPVR